MRLVTEEFQVKVTVDLKFEGMSDTEVSDLLSIIVMGLEVAREQAKKMDGPLLEARHRLIATGEQFRKELDQTENIMQDYTKG